MAARSCVQVLRRGAGHSAGRSGAHVRQVLPRRAAPTAGAPAPVWGSPSAAASSRRWAARSRPPIAPTARARCSPSRCRSPVDAETAEETAAMTGRRRPAAASWSSTTSRRSGAFCAPAWQPGLLVIEADDRRRRRWTRCAQRARRSGGARSRAARHRRAGGDPAHPRRWSPAADHRAVEPRATRRPRWRRSISAPTTT